MASLDESWLKKRHERYLADNYLALHNTVVSVTLAVAGLAAGNLIALPSDFAGYGFFLWILWGASLSATLVAFTGTATGAGVLPSKLPSVVDLISPLLLGISECLMFGVLARQAQGLVASPPAIIEAWYYSLAAFGAAAALAILQARRLVQSAVYEPGLTNTMDAYARGLHVDAAGAGAVGLLGLGGGIWSSFGGAGLHPTGNYILVGGVMAAFVGGFVSHSSARRRFQAVT